MENKMCSKCKKVKPITEFTRSKKSVDGYFSICKDCKSIYNREYYQRNKTSKFRIIGFLYGQRILKPHVYGENRFQKISFSELYERLQSDDGLPSGMILERDREIFVVASDQHHLLSFDEAVKDLTKIPIMRMKSGQFAIGFVDC